jgi:hypothetical protein
VCDSRPHHGLAGDGAAWNSPAETARRNFPLKVGMEFARMLKKHRYTFIIHS